MEPQEFWNTYVQDIQPEDFVWRYGRGKVTAAVDEYLRQRPSLFGIVRRATWRATFRANHQFTLEFVSTGIREYLESTEEDWRPKVEEAREQEARLKAEAKARAEAEALALAVARVEAEARARAEAERLKAMTPDAEHAPGTPEDTVPAVSAQEQATAEPVPAEPMPAEPVPVEPVMVEPVMVEPASIEPADTSVLPGEVVQADAFAGARAREWGHCPKAFPAGSLPEHVDILENESCVAFEAGVGETLQENVGAEPSDATGQTTDTDAPATS